jgi:chemotaxis protein MotB
MLAPVPVKTGMPQPAADGAAAAAGMRARALQQVADQVARAMDDLVKANLVVVRRTDYWIEVEIRTDILFPSASAQLEPNAVSVIEKLGEALAPYPNSIRVEGHTDDRPIKTVAFISNWELSAARAGSVVRVLASKGVNPQRLAVIGYGENRPTHGNDTVDGRNANRRVVVVILSADASQAMTPKPSTDSAQAAVGDAATAAPGDAATPASPDTAATSSAQGAPIDLSTPTTSQTPVQTTTSTVAPTRSAPSVTGVAPVGANARVNASATAPPPPRSTAANSLPSAAANPQ